MKRFGILGAAALAAAVSAPLSVSAMQVTPPSHTSYYQLTLERQIGVQYPWQGTLQLQISPGGYINGWYRPYGDGRFIEATGGLHDGNVWLEIGSGAQPLELTGSVGKNGVWKGGAFVGPVPYQFTAVRETKPVQP